MNEKTENSDTCLKLKQGYTERESASFPWQRYREKRNLGFSTTVTIDSGVKQLHNALNSARVDTN